MRRLAHRTLQALSEAVVALYACTDLVQLPHVAIRVLQRVVPGDFAAYNSFGREIQTIHNSDSIPHSATEAFAHFVHQHPSIEYLNATGDAQAVKISDFLPNQKWRRTSLYGEVFGPLNLNYQLGLIFEGVDARIGFSVNRGSHDYSEEERLALNLLIPHLKQAFVNSANLAALRRVSSSFPLLEVDQHHRITFATEQALALLQKWFMPSGDAASSLPPAVSVWLKRATAQNLQIDAPPVLPAVFSTPAGRLTIRLGTRAPGALHHQLLLEEKSLKDELANLKRLGLTPRESEILLWVGKGKSNAVIAIILGCKVSTVNTHLEHVFAKLGVESRTAAVSRAFGAPD
jgi:DNA-binding CsgD family transcriptional regulator